jgi:hypothetical protein
MRRALSIAALERRRTPLVVILDNMEFFEEKAVELLMQINEGVTKIAAVLDTISIDEDSLDQDAKNILERLRDAVMQNPAKNFSVYNEMLRLKILSQEAAVDAAPYVHPRLANIQHSVDPRGDEAHEQYEPALQQLTDDEVDELERIKSKIVEHLPAPDPDGGDQEGAGSPES